jgi:pyruvate dehydrogenase E2 component (dihydrolipoamide acetyltransferase)
VFDVMAEKTNAQITCPHTGRIAKIHVKEGETVPVGGLLLTIEESAGAEKQPQPAEKGPEEPRAEARGEAPAAEKHKEPAPAEAKREAPKERELPPPAGKTVPPPEPARTPSPREEPGQRPSQAPPKFAPATATVQMPGQGAAPEVQSAVAQAVRRAEIDTSSIPASPNTRRFARELGIDLAQVVGSGPGGRITREDVIEAVRQFNKEPTSAATPSIVSPPAIKGGIEDKDAWGRVIREPLSRIRKTIAANMARSASTIPHVTNFDDADITELERIRKGSMADYVDKNVKLTMMAFVIKAVAHSLKLHPEVNASLDLESEQVIYKQYVNIGIAVDTERGLVVPVMRHVDRMSIPQIALGLTTLSDNARANRIGMDDMRGGTFTISNLGAIGGQYSTPIINYPEVAILLVGRSRKLPVVIDDQIQTRLMMPLSLSYDHRWIDGATAARFLNEVIGFLQVPGRLLLAP